MEPIKQATSILDEAVGLRERSAAPTIQPDGSTASSGPSPVSQAYADWRKAPTPKSMGTLLGSMNTVIDKALGSRGMSDSPLLRSAAKKIAIGAIKKYDPQTAKGPLEAWVATNMQGLQRQRGELKAFALPERTRLLKMRIAETRESFALDNGRDPTQDELSDILHVPRRRVLAADSAANDPYAESTATGEEDSVAGEELGTTPDNGEQVWMDYVYHDMTPEEKTIYDMRVGRGRWTGKPAGVVDVATAIGRSPSYVSIRAQRLADRLADRPEIFS